MIWHAEADKSLNFNSLFCNCLSLKQLRTDIPLGLATQTHMNYPGENSNPQTITSCMKRLKQLRHNQQVILKIELFSTNFWRLIDKIKAAFID